MIFILLIINEKAPIDENIPKGNKITG